MIKGSILVGDCFQYNLFAGAICVKVLAISDDGLTVLAKPTKHACDAEWIKVANLHSRMEAQS